jgi:hypothetical protein
MIIHWNPNPLKSSIELNEHEREILRLKIHIEILENKIYDAHYHLKGNHGKDRIDVALGVDSLKPERLKETIDGLFGIYLKELSDYHSGDCCCIPCSCLKCHVEVMLGVNTMKGLRQHEASHIRAAFAHDNNFVINIEDCITWLRNYEPEKKGDWSRINFESHVARWKQEARNAALWLAQYREAHFKDGA